MIRIQTWIALILLIALVGFAVYLNNRDKTSSADTTPTAGNIVLFDASEGQPSSIEINSELGDTVKIARNSENVWVLELPEKAEADQGSVEAAVSQITSLRVLGEVKGDAEIFGLDKPAYVLNIEFTGGKTRTLEIGDNTPTNSGYYVRLDQGKILIVGLSGIDSLTNLLVFPPYLSTPTPSPLPPTATPVAPATTQATVTPIP